MRAIILLALCFITTIPCAYSKDVPLEVLRAQKRQPRKKPHKIIRIRHHQPARDANQQRSRYTFYPGSMKKNISHLAKQFGWHNVVWLPNYDYSWVGVTRFKPSNIKDILRQVLHNLPLQAIFYQGNHILVIAPRNIQ